MLFLLAAFVGFDMVPSLHPLETLHNALTFKDMDYFLGQATSTKFATPISSPHSSSMHTAVTPQQPPPGGATYAPDKGKVKFVLFNDATGTHWVLSYHRLLDVIHMVTLTHFLEGNSLPPHRLLFSISSKGCLYALFHRHNSTYHGSYLFYHISNAIKP